MFKVYSEEPFSQGFSMKFANGWTVSVQFGKRNYSDNPKGASHAHSAEIAAWDENGVWYHFNDSNNTVKGWVSPDGVVNFISMIAAK